MIFSKKKYLSVLHINNNVKEITFDILADILLEKPTNMIYCEKAGKLYGLISIGDVHRAKEEKKRAVGINTSFTYLQGYEYMKARKIFLENKKINALPIVNEKHELIGDYSRWDDTFGNYQIEFLKGNKFAEESWKKYRQVAIVMPSIQLPRKMKVISKWNDFFEEIGIEVEVIQKEDVITSFRKKDLVLFIDEDEIRGLGALYRDILNKDFDWEKAKTLEAVGEEVGKEIEKKLGEEKIKVIEETLLRSLIEDGIHIITLQVKENNDDYWKKLNSELDEKFKKIGKERVSILYEELWKDFYNDIYNDEYAMEVCTHPYPVYLEEGIPKLKDMESKYYNVKGGERLTVGQPNEYNNTIYFFGPCLVIGWYVEDAHTIESQLQAILNSKGIASKVVNCGCWSDELQLYQRICSTKFKKGDIVLIYDQGKNFADILSIDLGECLLQNNIPSKWFCNSSLHPNHKVFSLWARKIYEQIPKYWMTKEIKGNRDIVREKYSLMTFVYIEKYFGNCKPQGVIGAIVMNCNPFTEGHRYLIEEASKKVDYLIIFVVEEDRSLFSFKERFAMVVEGTKDMANLKVVPSGKFILSQQTFPEYFIKAENVNTVQNAEYDIKLFAEGIASKLDIKYRFVGEEKNDAVTREYNEAMKKILPTYGIELVEIPRKPINGEINSISATIVRKMLESNDWDKVCNLVPRSTIDVLNIL